MAENKDETKYKVFKITQKFLNDPPLIIWGSGATIPFGLPSMSDLNEILKDKIEDFNDLNDNLEIELDKEKYKDNMHQIKQIIWDKVNISDIDILQKIVKNNIPDLNGINLLLEKFINIHPKVLNIVTTNYDRVLEHLMSYNNIKFTDGFDGKTLSIFENSQFKNKDIVNLIKVHGSLNWFNINGETRYTDSRLENSVPQIISPGSNKYEEVYNSPYRELIQKSDGLIENAKSFLVVGFGFNDKHLTPKIITKIKTGIPVVLIAKKISDSSFDALEDANKYILFEEESGNNTKIIYRKDDSEGKKEEILDGDFWKLNQFMGVL